MSEIRKRKVNKNAASRGQAQVGHRVLLAKKRARRRIFWRRCGVVLVALLFLIFSAALAVGACVLVQRVTFKVATVEVFGESRYEPDEILPHLSVKPGDSWLLYSQKNDTAFLPEALPYLSSVKIKKKFPDKVQVTLECTHVAFCTPFLEGFALLDERFKVLEIVPEIREDLSVLQGVKAEFAQIGKPLDAQNFKEFSSVAKVLRDGFLRENLKLTSINFENISAINAQVDGRVSVNLGDKEGLEQKIMTACEIIARQLAQKETGGLDVSHVPIEGKSYFKPIKS